VSSGKAVLIGAKAKGRIKAQECDLLKPRRRTSSIRSEDTHRLFFSGDFVFLQPGKELAPGLRRPIFSSFFLLGPLAAAEGRSPRRAREKRKLAKEGWGDLAHHLFPDYRGMTAVVGFSGGDSLRLRGSS